MDFIRWLQQARGEQLDAAKRAAVAGHGPVAVALHEGAYLAYTVVLARVDNGQPSPGPSGIGAAARRPEPM
jgi:hypothetical protein